MRAPNADLTLAARADGYYPVHSCEASGLVKACLVFVRQGSNSTRRTVHPGRMSPEHRSFRRTYQEDYRCEHQADERVSNHFSNPVILISRLE